MGSPETEELDSILHVHVIQLAVSKALAYLVDPDENDGFLDGVKALKQDLSCKFGFVIPTISVQINPQLPPHSYSILIRERKVVEGEVNGTHETIRKRGNVPITRAHEIVEAKPEPSAATVLGHLREILLSHAPELLGREETEQLLAMLAAKCPHLMRDVIPDLLKVDEIQRVLQDLLKKGRNIGFLRRIMEALIERVSGTRSREVLAAAAIEALDQVDSHTSLESRDREASTHVLPDGQDGDNIDPPSEDFQEKTTRAGEVGKKGRNDPQGRFQSIPGLTWEKIAIEFISDDTVLIKAGKARETYLFAEMGFKDRRNGRPDRCWKLLIEMAKAGAGLSWNSNIRPSVKAGAKVTISSIRRSLKAFFQIEEDPFKPYKSNKAYVPRFLLHDRRGDN